jgi:hypothetical protein
MIPVWRTAIVLARAPAGLAGGGTRCISVPSYLVSTAGGKWL